MPPELVWFRFVFRLLARSHRVALLEYTQSSADLVLRLQAQIERIERAQQSPLGVEIDYLYILWD